MPTYLSVQVRATLVQGSVCGSAYMDEDSANRREGKMDTGEANAGVPDPSCTPAPPVAGGMTLEQIIDVTGEFSHLNDLVMIHIEKAGGFTGPEEYLRTVEPILDLLEVEIRIRFSAGMTQQQMKLIVQDWIDQEIRACTVGTGIHEP